jgi:beta-phosphoglucomutase
MEYGFIFDMDGVIIDTNPYHRISWGKFIRGKGLPYSDELFNNFLSGQTGATSIRALLDENLSDVQIQEYVQKIDGHFRDIFRDSPHVEAFPGVVSFLDAVCESGIRTGLATSAPPENVNLVMERLGIRERFGFILDSTTVNHGKPNPEIYNNSVQCIGLDNSQCIVFEDSKSGIQSAIAAGLKVVGVSSTHTSTELLEEGVDLAIEDFNGLSTNDIIKLLQ